MSKDDAAISIAWDKLDSVSEAVRSEIFKNFADGISKVIDSAGITKKQLYKIWKDRFADATEEDFQEFEKGIGDMARFRSYSKAAYMDQLEAAGDILDE